MLIIVDQMLNEMDLVIHQVQYTAMLIIQILDILQNYKIFSMGIGILQSDLFYCL